MVEQFAFAEISKHAVKARCCTVKTHACALSTADAAALGGAHRIACGRLGCARSHYNSFLTRSGDDPKEFTKLALPRKLLDAEPVGIRARLKSVPSSSGTPKPSCSLSET